MRCNRCGNTTASTLGSEAAFAAANGVLLSGNGTNNTVTFTQLIPVTVTCRVQPGTSGSGCGCGCGC